METQRVRLRRLDRSRYLTRPAGYAVERSKAISLVAVLALLVASGAVGCSRVARHKVLTVFFTGVPPLEEEADEPRPEDEEAGGANTPAVLRPLGPRQSSFWVHGPYGSGNCGGCHEVANSFRSATSGSGGRRFSSIQPAGARLMAPLEKLCESCHTRLTNEATESLGLWLHAPAARGICVACHHPHQSRRRYMLRGENMFELCTQCHDSEEIARGGAHTDDPALDCLECHNPHLGSNSLLLRAEYDESPRGPG